MDRDVGRGEGALGPDELARLDHAAGVDRRRGRRAATSGATTPSRPRTGPAICRTENVSACDADVRALVDGPLRAIASARLGTDATAFKDKINYKQPGGAGFLPHQDRSAYPGAPDLVSLLVAIDACSEQSGSLWIAPEVDHPLPTDDRGVVEAHVTDALDWQIVELAPGDALMIDGWAPHWSGANDTDRPRRVLVRVLRVDGVGLHAATSTTRRGQRR